MVEKQLGYKYQVYNEIKKGIMTGVYPPGFVMNEKIVRRTRNQPHADPRGDADACQRWLAADGNIQGNGGA